MCENPEALYHLLHANFLNLLLCLWTRFVCISLARLFVLETKHNSTVHEHKVLQLRNSEFLKYINYIPLATHMHTLNSQSLFLLVKKLVCRDNKIQVKLLLLKNLKAEVPLVKGSPRLGIVGSHFLCETELQSLKETLPSFTPVTLLTFSLLACWRAPLCLAKAPGIQRRWKRWKFMWKLGKKKPNTSEHILPDLNNSD